ncbi:Cupin 2, conserved barrel [Penicillium digitatum]|jgi:quercetin dioxygenase-like cupin family protein|uniref:Cupin 2 conserved barrel domain-containing protein n=2 Tax=Penicillium digitatum TaxID=36651 RepID=K9F7W9_PEND1|nr:hypothetical protein PDIP_83180 [Penicillium digitatum Pd1]EKV05460.1 hypothetical protein PDIP_83180 [Penicillium digitatum Pd1]KAG0161418.1 hypothetical protein PDIDSM_8952 [Penicillium digitatum]QQK40300.1 Cupin 2, conserved barrel [Penicillium digitatum]
MASNTSQLSSLRAITRHVTGHNENGKAVIHSSTPAEWESLQEKGMAFNVVYTNQFYPDLNNDADVKTYETLKRSNRLGLVNPGGTVCRIVDFAPNNRAVVHRTQSLDYGVVLEGQIEMILEDSDPVIMNRGGVAVQRATMHGWRNTSETEWARLLFVLQDCNKLTVAGKEMGEDLGIAAGVLKPSGNS